MFGLGFGELLVILVVVVLLFGSRKLPELARAMGQSLSEFKKGRKDADAIDVSKPTNNNKIDPPTS